LTTALTLAVALPWLDLGGGIDRSLDLDGGLDLDNSLAVARPWRRP